jgi:hypothetical protein
MTHNSGAADLRTRPLLKVDRLCAAEAVRECAFAGANFGTLWAALRA